VIDLGSAGERLAPRFGASAAAWVSGLPDRITSLAARWRFEPGEAFETGHSSVVLRCTRPAGPAVLKLSPDEAGVAEEVAALRGFAAGGQVPAVFEYEEDAVLLEAIEPGTSLDGSACPPVPEFAALLRALHRGDPASASRDLRGWTDVIFDSAIRRGVELGDAGRIRDRLLSAKHHKVLLHGDLHFGNLLDGGTRGLVAIDPMACTGDPCFDAVDYILAASDRGELARRRDGLAVAADLDAERLDAWCRATAPIAAASAPAAQAAELSAYLEDER
jgi:streptomycin 6-kinase